MLGSVTDPDTRRRSLRTGAIRTIWIVCLTTATAGPELWSGRMAGSWGGCLDRVRVIGKPADRVRGRTKRGCKAAGSGVDDSPDSMRSLGSPQSPAIALPMIECAVGWRKPADVMTSITRSSKGLLRNNGATEALR
jgi:hypothetical protein